MRPDKLPQVELTSPAVYLEARQVSVYLDQSIPGEFTLSVSRGDDNLLTKTLSLDRERVNLEDADLPLPDPSSDEIREMLDRCGLSQRACARVMRVSDRTVRHWCAGTVEMPYPNWLALHYLESLTNE